MAAMGVVITDARAAAIVRAEVVGIARVMVAPVGVVITGVQAAIGRAAVAGIVLVTGVLEAVAITGVQAGEDFPVADDLVAAGEETMVGVIPAADAPVAAGVIPVADTPVVVGVIPVADTRVAAEVIPAADIRVVVLKLNARPPRSRSAGVARSPQPRQAAAGKTLTQMQNVA